MTVLEFLGTPTGTELVRAAESVLAIAAAILSGTAARNARQARDMIGGVAGRTVRQWLHGWIPSRRSHVKSPTGRTPDALQSLTLDQKLEELKRNQELQWVANGLALQEIARHLSRIDPPNGRHTDD